MVKLQVIQASVWSLDGDAYGTMVFCVYDTMYTMVEHFIFLFAMCLYNSFVIEFNNIIVFNEEHWETTVDDEYALISTSYNRERKTENNNKKKRESEK